MTKSNLKKIDLINYLNEKKGLSISFSKKIIQDLLDIIIYLIIKNNFNLKNVGSFKILNKKERIGRNPKTKKKYLINSRKTVSFKASKNILKMLNH